jgi:hypothetical protein
MRLSAYRRLSPELRVICIELSVATAAIGRVIPRARLDMVNAFLPVSDKALALTGWLARMATGERGG